MDYFDDVFISFLEKYCTYCICSMERQKALGLDLKYLKLCSKDERRSYWLGMK